MYDGKLELIHMKIRRLLNFFWFVKADYWYCIASLFNSFQMQVDKNVVGYPQLSSIIARTNFCVTIDNIIALGDG